MLKTLLLFLFAFCCLNILRRILCDALSRFGRFSPAHQLVIIFGFNTQQQKQIQKKVKK